MADWNKPGRSFRPRRFGRFVLTERVGAGATAEVFRASEPGGLRSRDYAIKRILPHIGQQEEFAAMFVDEANVMVSLDHPCIVQVYEFGEVEEVLYIAMEYVHGMDARELIAKCRAKGHRLPPPLAIYIAMETLRGLDFAHNAHDYQGRPLRIVHRDVSPGNILITWTGDVKLGDFGIARDPMSRSHSLIAANAGKLGYMSPEQVLRHNVNRQSDIFSLAVVLYELLTGYPLFDEDSELDTMLAIRDVAYGSRVDDATYIPAQIRSILKRALQPSTADRFQSAAAFYRALDAAVDELNWDRNAEALASFLQHEFESDYVAHNQDDGFDLPLDESQRVGVDRSFILEDTDPGSYAEDRFYSSQSAPDLLLSPEDTFDRTERDTINLIIEPIDREQAVRGEQLEELEAFDLLSDIQSPDESSGIEFLEADGDSPIVELEPSSRKPLRSPITASFGVAPRPQGQRPTRELEPNPTRRRRGAPDVIEEELVLADDEFAGFIEDSSVITDPGSNNDVDFEMGFDDLLEEPSGDFDQLLDSTQSGFPNESASRPKPRFDSNEYRSILESLEGRAPSSLPMESGGTVPGYPKASSGSTATPTVPTPPHAPPAEPPRSTRPPTPPPLPPLALQRPGALTPGIPAPDVETRSELAQELARNHPETAVAEAIHLRRHRRLEEAMQLLQREFYGDHPVCAMLEHAQCRQEFGQAAEALKELGELIDTGLLSRSDTQLAEYYRALAHEYVGDRPAALSTMRALLATDEERFPDLRVRLKRLQ